jgi:hypothetical protein
MKTLEQIKDEAFSDYGGCCYEITDVVLNAIANRYAQQAIEATKAQCLANIMAQVDTFQFADHPSAVIRDVIMKTEIKLP